MKSLVAMVTGAGGPAGRAVSEFFNESGIAVMRADMNVIAGSDFTRLPAAADHRFIQALEQELDRCQIGLLVPTVTEELPKISLFREAIRQKSCAVFLSASEAVLIANDKWLTALALSRRGILIPRSYSGTSKEALVADVSFPMLSKPRCSRGGRGIELHAHAGQLPTVLSETRIFQEFLEGDEYDVNLFSEPGGSCSACVVLKKTALKNGIIGNALSVQRVHEPDVAELARSAVSALGLEGPIDIDIRRGSDGFPRVLEINARVGANVRAAEEVLAAILTNWRIQL